LTYIRPLLLPKTSPVGVRMLITVSIILIVMWLVGIYNFGYIFAAKALGYTVTNASIGAGPVLYSFALGATSYHLSLIPIGGYVKIKEREVSVKYLIFTCAGPLAMLLLAFLITPIQLMVGSPHIVNKGAVIVESSENTPDLKKDDVIIMVGDHPVYDGLDLFEKLTNWNSGELTLLARRDGQDREIRLKRKFTERESKPEKLGIVFGSVTELKQLGLLDSLKTAPGVMVKFIGHVIVSSILAFTHQMPRLLPPTSTSTSSRVSAALEVTSFLSSAFAIFNMLPIPVLIGGEASILAVELIRKRPFSDHRRERMQQVGFLIVFLLMIIVLGSALLSNFGIMLPFPTITAERIAPIVRWSSPNAYWSA